MGNLHTRIWQRINSIKFCGLMSSEAIIFLALTCVAAVLFLDRISAPDNSYDVINYHLAAGAHISALDLLSMSKQFLPQAFWTTTPLLDNLNFAAYLAFGYRLGTFVSLISYLLMAYFALRIFKLIRGEEPLNLKGIVFAGAALVVNEGLFQLGTYYVDNTYAAIALAGFYLVIKFRYTGLSGRNLIVLGLLIGILLTKATNIFYLAAIFFVLLRHGRTLIYRPIQILTISIPAIATAAPFYLQMIFLTGNPVFPQLNSIFKSEFYPLENWNFNLGPRNLIERLFYPIFAIIDPTITGEVKDMFPDLKFIVLQVMLLVTCVLVFFKNKALWAQISTAISATILANFVWQATFGYTRYAIALEAITGILLASIFSRTIFKSKSSLLFSVSALSVAAIGIQSTSIAGFNLAFDLSWRSHANILTIPSSFSNGDIFRQETIVPRKAQIAFGKSDLILVCANASAGYARTIRSLDSLPFFNISGGPNEPITSNSKYVEARNSTFLQSQNQSLNQFSFITIITKSQIEECLTSITRASGESVTITPAEVMEINNFVGDQTVQLRAIFGTIDFAVKR